MLRAALWPSYSKVLVFNGGSEVYGNAGAPLDDAETAASALIPLTLFFGMALDKQGCFELAHVPSGEVKLLLAAVP